MVHPPGCTGLETVSEGAPQLPFSPFALAQNTAPKDKRCSVRNKVRLRHALTSHYLSLVACYWELMI
jgi:hypothetical protein